MKRALLAVTFSLAIALLLVEVGLRVFFSVAMDYDMEMFRYARTLKISAPGAESHVHKPSVHAHLMGVDLATNSHGLRDLERPYEKPAGHFRIVTLGDSFTLGWGVDFDKTFPHRLELALNRRPGSHPVVEVLNLGVGNYNTEQETASLLDEGVKYQPDMVILAFYINDAEPIQANSHGHWWEGSYALAFVKQRINQVRGWLDPRFAYANYYRDLYRGESWRRYREIFHRLAEACRERGLPLRPVLLPDLHDLKNYPFLEEHRKVTDLMREEGLDPLDLLPRFQGREGRPLWVAGDDPHPNAEAQGLIADGILRFSEQKKWVP